MNYQAFTCDSCRRFVTDHARKIQQKPENGVGASQLQTIEGWLRSRSLAELTSCTSIFAEHIRTADDMRFLMQVEAFFKKNKSFIDEETTAKAADQAFALGESQCLETNLRLQFFHDLDPLSERRRQVERMMGEIEVLLGDFNEFLDDLPYSIRITAGATTTRSRRKALPHLRLTPKMASTPTAIPYLRALGAFHGFGRVKPRIVAGNRLEKVPKNWKTDRMIACEPEGNVALQLAFDSFAKAKLHKWGINLSDQSRNQKYAREASLSDGLATIDLSMASDTLAQATVELLLPGQFYTYLDRVRSPLYRAGETWKTFQKFSSMGNGATFALETLVFAAACKAVGAHTMSVYGDDIIVNVEAAEPLIALLAYLGFTVNGDKSYLRGPFRESCGVNCYQGVDVTPFYVRDLDKRKSVLCHNINGLASIAEPFGELQTALADLVVEEKLPLVPFSEDTMAGVHVDVQTAYQLGILKWYPRHHCLRYKGYKGKSSRRSVSDARTYYLWFFRTVSRQKEEARPAWSPLDGDQHFESSWVSNLSHKYVKGWVHWYVPVAATPDHLRRWSDYFFAREG